MEGHRAEPAARTRGTLRFEILRGNGRITLAEAGTPTLRSNLDETPEALDQCDNDGQRKSLVINPCLWLPMTSRVKVSVGETATL